MPPGVLPMGSPLFDLREKLPPEVRDRRLNARDGLLPNSFYALPQSIVRAILEKDPYPVRLAYVQGSNPLLTYPHAGRVHQALRQLDFLAVADLFLTPTAALADVVLPAASFLEYDAVIAPPYYPVVQVQQKVAQVGECRSDASMIRGLARRLGLGEFFWESEAESLDFILQPAGLRFQEFRQIGSLSGHKAFRHYEKQGFATPSGKVELFSDRLREWGFDPLPVYRPLPETPDGSPEMVGDYPLVLTSWKVGAFRHSGVRQIETLRRSHPEAVVWIHPATAKALGIVEGDRVVIETARGRIEQRARITGKIHPRVVGADYAWWFPERGEERLFDWDKANVNMLTDDRRPVGSEMGTPQLRGFLCRVYKAECRPGLTQTVFPGGFDHGLNIFPGRSRRNAAAAHQDEPIGPGPAKTIPGIFLHGPGSTQEKGFHRFDVSPQRHLRDGGPGRLQVQALIQTQHPGSGSGHGPQQRRGVPANVQDTGQVDAAQDSLQAGKDPFLKHTGGDQGSRGGGLGDQQQAGAVITQGLSKKDQKLRDPIQQAVQHRPVPVKHAQDPIGFKQAADRGEGPLKKADDRDPVPAVISQEADGLQNFRKPSGVPRIREGQGVHLFRGIKRAVSAVGPAGRRG